MSLLYVNEHLQPLLLKINSCYHHQITGGILLYGAQPVVITRGLIYTVIWLQRNTYTLSFYCNCVWMLLLHVNKHLQPLLPKIVSCYHHQITGSILLSGAETVVITRALI